MFCCHVKIEKTPLFLSLNKAFHLKFPVKYGNILLCIFFIYAALLQGG
jgi:hypothetical protein